MLIVELQKNNVVNIPEKIVEKLKLKDGDLLDGCVREGKIVIVHINNKDIDD